MPSSSTPPAAPWWKFGYVWLVVSGPAIVVVASLVTFWLAASRPDPVYSDTRPAAAAPSAAPANPTLAPAMQARNHVATGGVARPRP